MEALGRAAFGAARRLAPAAADAGHLAFVHAVLEGAAPGGVLVDQAESPAWAIVCNFSGFFHALGEAPDDAGPALARVRSEFLGDEPTNIWAATDSWSAAFRASGEPLSYRTEFHPPAALPAAKALPGGRAVGPLGPELLGSFGAGLDPWVMRAWGGVDRFLREAMPVGVVDDGELLSFCCACAVGGAPGEREAEVEVGTVPWARQRGFARAAGAAFMTRCAGSGLVAAWTCASDNVASERLALALGFRRARTIVGIRLS